MNRMKSFLVLLVLLMLPVDLQSEAVHSSGEASTFFDFTEPSDITEPDISNECISALKTVSGCVVACLKAGATVAYCMSVTCKSQMDAMCVACPGRC